MSSTPFRQRVERKLSLAEHLANGDSGGDYSDACTIIAALISGIAAKLWPGDGIDRRRFVETWQRFADLNLTPTRISLPLLSCRFRERYMVKEAQAVEALRPAAFDPGKALALTGDQVDPDEKEFLKSCHNINLRELRERSYPAVFYELVRYTLLQEGGFETLSTPAATDHAAGVSYAHEISEVKNGEIRWRIHFALPWLFAVCRSIAEKSEPHLTSKPLGLPGSWWLRG